MHMRVSRTNNIFFFAWFFVDQPVNRGFMTQSGLPDQSRAARIILKDYVQVNDGHSLYCIKLIIRGDCYTVTHPPV